MYAEMFLIQLVIVVVVQVPLVVLVAKNVSAHIILVGERRVPRASLAPRLVCKLPSHDGWFIHIAPNKGIDVVLVGCLEKLSKERRETK